MQQASLQQLNDIVEPGAASWWPPAWPVVAIGMVILVVVAVVLWWLWRQHRARKPQRIALAKLQQLQRPSASDITLLCKRVALVYFPRQTIAKLNGKDWLTFIDAPAELVTQHDQLLYQPANHELINAYKNVAMQWIKQVRSQARSQTKKQHRGEHV
ncbi:DUF4381 domain-containing protein [Idiomarina sp.]|uniref:DUF4381 domain-containing protein n=1 Tax=Idiomarina sp. TaxID=1874361 RepID=UPI0025C0A206|nr:DUF4381 domain-containing protein [Idiomarina sp.]